MIKCLNCKKELVKISNMACPDCGAKLSHVLISFLTYLGPQDSLNGFQRSYKLVLLKCLFRELQTKNKAEVADVTEQFRNYYLARKENGLIPDKHADPVIANIENSSLRDIWLLILKNPYEAISKKGFLTIRGEGLNGVFALQKGIDNLSDTEISNLLSFLERKLELYYKSIGSETLKAKSTPKNNDGMIVLSDETARKSAPSSNKYSEEHQAVGLFGTPSPEVINKSIEEVFSENIFLLFRNFCSNNGLKTINDLVGLTDEQLSAIRGFGLSKLVKLYRRWSELSNQKYTYLSLGTSGEKSTPKTADLQSKELPQQKPKTSVRPAKAQTIPFHVHNDNTDISIAVLSRMGHVSAIVDQLAEGGIRSLGALNTVTMQRLRELHLDFRAVHTLIEMIKVFENPYSEFMNEALEDIAKNKHFEMFMKRVAGGTLQEIGDYYAITRERVRQICTKTEERIYRIVCPLIDRLFRANGADYFREEQVCSAIGSADLAEAVLYTLSENDAFFSFGSSRVYFDTTRYPEIDKKLESLAEEIVGEGISFFENESIIEESLDGAGFGFLNASDFLELLIHFGFVFCGDYVIRSKKSYGMLCAKLVEEHFPDGIKNTAEELSRLRELAKAKFGDLDLPESDRSFFSRVSDYLVLRGRSTYISPKHIYIDEGILSEIKSYIDEAEQAEIFYSEIFAAHEGLLTMMTNVDNHQFLHGVLSHFYPDDYAYSRDYLCKNDGAQRMSFGERIKEFIKKMGRPVSKQEIRNQFPGCSEITILSAPANTNGLLQWEYNFFNSTDNLTLSAEDITQLENALTELVEQNNGYCSEGMLYDVAQKQQFAFLDANSIKNSQNLFYTANEVLGKRFDFKRPHIAPAGRFAVMNTSDVALTLMDAGDQFIPSRFFKLAVQYKWPEATAGQAYREIEESYVRLAEDQYLRKDLFSMSESDISFAAELLENASEGNWYLPLRNFEDSEEIMPCSYKVNEFLMETVCAVYPLGWHIVYPQNRDRRYQKAILVHNTVPVYAYDVLVAELLAQHDIQIIAENDLLLFLQLRNLAMKTLHRELTVSSRLRYSDGVFEVL